MHFLSLAHVAIAGALIFDGINAKGTRPCKPRTPSVTTTPVPANTIGHSLSTTPSQTNIVVTGLSSSLVSISLPSLSSANGGNSRSITPSSSASTTPNYSTPPNSSGDSTSTLDSTSATSTSTLSPPTLASIPASLLTTPSLIQTSSTPIKSTTDASTPSESTISAAASPTPTVQPSESATPALFSSSLPATDAGSTIDPEPISSTTSTASLTTTSSLPPLLPTFYLKSANNPTPIVNNAHTLEGWILRGLPSLNGLFLTQEPTWPETPFIALTIELGTNRLKVAGITDDRYVYAEPIRSRQTGRMGTGSLSIMTLATGNLPVVCGGTPREGDVLKCNAEGTTRSGFTAVGTGNPTGGIPLYMVDPKVSTVPTYIDLVAVASPE